MATALVSNGDLGGMYTYSPASQSFTRIVLTSFALRLITIQYEIFGLTRIFNTDYVKKNTLLDGYEYSFICSWINSDRSLSHDATWSSACSIAHLKKVKWGNVYLKSPPITNNPECTRQTGSL